MNRDAMVAALRDRKAPWDVLVIGGGATGLGVAVDAAARGASVALVEQADFAKGTSSRSTKLVHGGVRYLKQGNVSLVMEALRERGLLARNAPHLVHDVPFIVPSYAWWESPFYGVGLKVYDLLAGKYGFGRSKLLGKDEVIRAIPSISTEGLHGGVRYFDGQFDDARLAVSLAATAVREGAVVANYARVEGLLKDASGHIAGAAVRDVESGDAFEVLASVVVNATGPFADGVRRLDRADAEPIIAPSQGAHIVVGREFLPGDAAIMVPHTDDGRVMFAIPWHDVVVIGTTDTPIDRVELEPRPLPEEVGFILETANRYLSRDVAPADVRSVFAGIRPLVRHGAGAGGSNTAALSRDHTVLIDGDSGLITVAGGKWTTYRRMAEDVVDRALELAGVDASPCSTRGLRIHGYVEEPRRHGRMAVYGSEAEAVEDVERSAPGGRRALHPKLAVTEGEVRWACRMEMARTVDDVLARRTRSVLFDAAAAIEAAPAVGRIMRDELGWDEARMARSVEEFTGIAKRHMLGGP